MLPLLLTALALLTLLSLLFAAFASLALLTLLTLLSLLLTTLASLTLSPLLSLCLAIATASLLTLLPRLSVSFILCLLSLLILLRRCLALSALAIGITLILAGLARCGTLPICQVAGPWPARSRGRPGRRGRRARSVLGEGQRSRRPARSWPRVRHLPQLLDALAGVPGCLGGIVGDSQVDQLLGDLERIGDLLLGRLPDRVVQLLGQERLGFLGVLDGAAHLLEQLIEAFFLLFEALADLLSLAGIAQRVLRGLVARLELLGDFSWSSPSCRACSRISVISSVNRLAAPFRSSSRRSFSCRPARAPSVRACGSRPCSSASEAWRTCSRPCSICCRASAIRSRFSSLSIRSLSSSVSRRICCCWSRSRLSCRSISWRACGRLGRLEGRLQLFEPLVHVGLALGQLAQPVKHLARFALFSFSLRQVLFLSAGRALLLVAVLIGVELELLKLPLLLTVRPRCGRSAVAAASCFESPGTRGRAA